MWFSSPWRASSAGLLLAAGALLGVQGSLHAQTGLAAAAAMPQSANPAQPELPGSRLLGEATFRYFGFSIYHVRLWARPDFRPGPLAEQPLMLELHYLRNFKGRAIAERSLQEMRRGGSFSEDQAQRWLARMSDIFPDIKDGDRLSGQHLPGQGARFWFNGRAAGQIDDPEFSRLFFGIWLAPTTSEPELRLALLGKAAGNSGP